MKRKTTGFLSRVLFLAIALWAGSHQTVKAQCSIGTPSFTIDFTGHPDSTWISPSVTRAGLCCGATSPDLCIEFIITLDTGSNGIVLDIYSGAKPSGSLYYSIGCSGSYQVGKPICLSGVGPHKVRFCKPGSNNNQYILKTIPKPKISPGIISTQACSGKIWMVGVNKDSTQWSSVPSNATYESYLSCTTGCDTVTVTPTGAFPTSVIYKGCGSLMSGCSSSKFCDTVKVTFAKNLSVAVVPQDPYICFGDSSAVLTAKVKGGFRPLSYSWSNGKTDSFITVGAGKYTVTVMDSLKCQSVTDSTTVHAYTMAIKALPGNDTSICSDINSLKLNGKIQSATGGKWLGSGTFKANDTILNATYTFTASEKSAGYSSLKLATTGNNGCPPDTGTMKVTFMPTPAPIISGPDSTCSNRAYTYSVAAIAGSTYNWTVTGGTIGSGAGTNSIKVLWGAAGTGKVSITQISGFGCDSSVNKTVKIMPTPAPVIVGSLSACSNKAYTYSVVAVAGSSYNWSVIGGAISGTNTSNTVKILWGATGTGKVTVKQTSSFGCDSTISTNITIMPTPAPVVSGPDSTCSNKAYTYSITAIAGSTYNWTATGGAISGSSTSNTVKVLWGAAGTGKVTVKQVSSFGCDSTISKTVLILATPSPVISGLDSTCSNKAYNYSIAAIAGSTYKWTVLGGAISGSSTNSAVKVLWGAAGTGTLTVKQTSSFGCDSTISKTVKILPTPAPVISGPDSTCSNKTYTYSITAIAGSTYSWTVTGGAISGSSTTNSIKVLWGATGTGTVNVKQTSSFGCDSSIGKTVKIKPTPAPVISGPDSTCSNKAYTYSITAISGSTYSWSVTGGAISGSSTNNTVKVLWGATGTGKVTVKQTSSFGCDSTISKNVKIMPTPAPVISGPDSTCSNKAYTYSIAVIAGSTYSWTATGGNISGSSTNNTVKVLWGATGTGKVTVKQISSFGCDSTISKNITIVPTPAPVISGPDSTCSNKAYTYSITAIAGSTYKWTATGGAISGSSTNNSVKILWGATGTGTVTVKQVSSFGCDSTISKNVKIMPTPAPVISGPDSTCSNKAYSYSIAAIAGSTYSWSVTGGAISGSSTNNTVKVLWGATGTGKVTVKQTSSFGCDSTISKNVKIMPTPAPVISGPDSTCSNKAYTYSITAIAGSTYSWTVTGGAISGSSTTNSIKVLWGATGTGIVNVKQTSSFGCDSGISMTVKIMPTPAPVISGPDSTCSNKAYTYSITAISSSTYSWSVTGGAISGYSANNTVKVLWGATGTGKVTVKQTSSFGCDSAISKTVKIMPTPAPVISGPDSTCSNKAYTYSIAAIAGSTYSWTTTGGAISGSSTSNTVKVLWGATGAGKVTVKQTSSFGCDSTISKNVKIMPTPAPVISGPDSTCSNKAYTYSITAIAGSTYKWTVAGGAISGSSTSNTVKILWGATGTGTATVKQTSSFGCDSTISKNVKILPTPAPIISGPDSTCSNKAYTYSITSIAGSTYKWTAIGGAISGSSTGNAVKVLWGVAGTGTITIKQTSAFGCDSSISKTVKILPTPAPVISGPDSACSNKSYTYSIAAIAGSSYNWTVTGGAISGSNSGNAITVLWGATGAGKVTVKQTSSFGCDSTIGKNVKIKPTPAPVINGPDSTCSNKAYTYSITAIVGSTYKWTATGGAVTGSSTGNTVKVLWGGTGAGTVTVTQTSSFGCDSTISKTVKIVPTPAPIISGPDSICSNRVYTYSVAAIAGSKYAWKVSGGFISGSPSSASVSVLWGGIGSGKLTLTQTSAFGCDSTITKNVTIVGTPAPVISGPDSACETKIYSYSVDAIGGNKYQWSVVGGAIMGVSNASTVAIKWDTAGTGFVTVKQTSAFGCDSTVTRKMSIMPTPTPVISGFTTTCQYKIYTYMVTIYNGNKYSWTVTGGTIQGPSDSNIIRVAWGAPGKGKIQITQTSAFGCDSTVSRDINILPTPTPDLVGPDGACQNKVYSYSVKAVNGNKYVWSVKGGTFLGSSTGNLVAVRWGAPGKGTITLVQTNASGCDSTVSKTVNIITTPAPIIQGPNKPCERSLVKYYSGVKNVVFSWDVNGGRILGSVNDDTISVIWDSTGTRWVQLTVISPFGCDSTIRKSINVLSNPLERISGPDIVCQNHAYTYQVTKVPSNSYGWSLSGGGYFAGGDSSSPVVNIRWVADGNYTLYMKYQNTNGCFGDDKLNIQVLNFPVPAINGEKLGCANSKGNPYKANTYALQKGSVKDILYYWSVSKGAPFTVVDKTIIVVDWGAPGTYTIYLRQVNSITGCEDTTSFNVLVDSMIKPRILGDQLAGCYPLSVNLSEKSGQPDLTYTWYFENGPPEVRPTVSRTFTKIGSNLVQLIVTNKYGCRDSVKIKIDVYPVPKASFKVVNDIPIYTEDTPTFVNTSTGANSYRWDMGESDIVYTQDVRKQFKQPGQYDVWLWAYNSYGCVDSANKKLTIKVKPLIIIPNAFTPNNNDVNDYFSVVTEYITQLDIIIYDRWGGIIYRSDQIDFKWDGYYMDKVVPTGVYPYLIFAKGFNGEMFTMTGEVHVIR